MLTDIFSFRRRAWSGVWLLLIPLFTLVACGDDQSPSAPAVASVSIAPVLDDIPVGGTITLSATVKSSSGAPLNRVVQWTSDNEAVATVSSTGVLVARGGGVAGIRATADQKSSRVEVRVVPLAPVPAITGTLPAELIANATATTLTVLGANFTAASVVEWNGLPRNTEFISATELRVPLSITDTRHEGTGLVRVRTPAPGGGSTGVLSVPIVPLPSPAPTITRFTPSEILARTSSNVVVTIIGTGFTPATQVYVDDQLREVDYFGATTLRIILTPTDLVNPRHMKVLVQTPAPGGGAAASTLRVYEVPVARIDLVDPLNPFGAPWTWVGWALELKATPFSALGLEILNRDVVWSQSTPERLQLYPESDNLVRVYGAQVGNATLRATIDQKSAEVEITSYAVPQYDIVYSTGTGENQHLRLWSPWLGNAPRPLLTSLIATDPSPSPDGQWVAFTGTPKGQGPTGNPDIYVVRRDGTGLRRLTTSAGADVMPAWSPNGQRIAYASSRANGTLDIWTMDLNGEDQRQLTTSRLTMPVSGSGISATAPAWSPDGLRLAYVVNANFGLTLWTMAADGTDKLPLTSPTGETDNFPSWSPDGRYIIFMRYNQTNRSYTVQAVTPDGLTAFPFRFDPVPQAARPSYSPDGKWIMSTTSDPNAPSNLYAMPSNGEKAQRIMISQELLGARHARWMRKP